MCVFYIKSELDTLGIINYSERQTKMASLGGVGVLLLLPLPCTLAGHGCFFFFFLSL